MPDWISVKDRMPEANTPVLVWSSPWKFSKTGKLAFGAASVAMLHEGYDDSWKMTVTHWMPLPDPPKADE